MSRERKASVAGARHGIARALSKRGLCSRSEAARWVAAGRVRLNGRLVRDPEQPTCAADRIEVDGSEVLAAAPVHVALHKPRGLVTTRSDEKDRDTVYACLAGSGLPWLAPVGRLDRASEGLLLLSNDPEWAAAVSAGGRVDKVYHVQVGGVADTAVLERLRGGLCDAGEWLQAESVQVLRSGGRTTWLEFVLRTGRNRQIRRMLAQVGLPVRRLLRVSIGPLQLGELRRGEWRTLSAAEAAALAAAVAGS